MINCGIPNIKDKASKQPEKIETPYLHGNSGRNDGQHRQKQRMLEDNEAPSLMKRGEVATKMFS